MAVEISINRATKTMVMPQGEAEHIKEIVGGRIRKVGALTSAGGTNRWIAGGDLDELADVLRAAGSVTLKLNLAVVCFITCAMAGKCSCSWKDERASSLARRTPYWRREIGFRSRLLQSAAWFTKGRAWPVS